MVKYGMKWCYMNIDVKWCDMNVMWNDVNMIKTFIGERSFQAYQRKPECQTKFYSSIPSNRKLSLSVKNQPQNFHQHLTSVQDWTLNIEQLFHQVSEPHSVYCRNEHVKERDLVAVLEGGDDSLPRVEAFCVEINVITEQIRSCRQLERESNILR